jgi:hypothetical protein
MYAVQYQLSDIPVPRAHRTLRAALRDLRSCQRAARDGGDEQAIYIVQSDGWPLTEEEERELDALMGSTW